MSAISIGRALRGGAGAAWSAWPSFVAAFLAGTVASLASAAMAGLFWLGLSGQGASTLALGAGGLTVLWLIAQLVRALSFGVGARQAAFRLRGEAAPGFTDALGTTAPASLGWFGTGILLEIVRALWQALALVSTGFAFLHALISGRHGLSSAFLLALAVVACLAFALGLRLWLDFGFARAMARGESFLTSLFDAAGELWREPWPPLAVLVVTALAAFVFGIFASLAPGQLVSPEGARALWILGAVISAAFTAFVEAGAVLWRLGAFCALTLSKAGELPTPPPARAERILEAEPILEARPVPEP